MTSSKRYYTGIVKYQNPKILGLHWQEWSISMKGDQLRKYIYTIIIQHIQENYKIMVYLQIWSRLLPHTFCGEKNISYVGRHIISSSCQIFSIEFSIIHNYSGMYVFSISKHSWPPHNFLPAIKYLSFCRIIYMHICMHVFNKI